MMGDVHWQTMLEYQQELHHLSRALLSQSQRQTLTASERELLARIYLQPGESTPLALSRCSGMKKEAVSRCLKRLHEKACIRKERHPQDDRSYILQLTETGERELRESYGAILRPLYELRRSMGTDAFEQLFTLIGRANQKIG